MTEITATLSTEENLTAQVEEQADLTATVSIGVVSNSGVTSWNGETGDVTYTAPVTSVNGETGDVTVSVPVTSVNGKTGAVLTAKVIPVEFNFDSQTNSVDIDDYDTLKAYIQNYENVMLVDDEYHYYNIVYLNGYYVWFASVIINPNLTYDIRKIIVNFYNNTATADYTDTNVKIVDEENLEEYYTMTDDLAAVALSNDYDDLDNLPTIPTATSDLTNDSGYLTSSNAVTSFNGSVGAVTYTAPITSVNGSTGAITGLQTTSNLVTSISASSTDDEYPSAKCVYDIVGDIETLLAAI